MTTAMVQPKQFGECAERYHGLYPGVVTGDIDEDGKCRVKLRFEWIAQDFVSEWAPVAQIYAGDGWGGHWIPEEDDQVVVSFLHGELRRPIVLGSLFSGVRLPPLTKTEDVDPKFLRTKGGHMLLMEDGKGVRIEIVDSSGANSIKIDTENNHIEITADADIRLSAGANVTIDAASDVTVTSSGSLTLDSSADVTISAAGTVSVSATTINLNS